MPAITAHAKKALIPDASDFCVYFPTEGDTKQAERAQLLLCPILLMSNDASSHSASGCPASAGHQRLKTDRQTDGPVDDIMFFCISPVSPPSGGSSGF